MDKDSELVEGKKGFTVSSLFYSMCSSRYSLDKKTVVIECLRPQGKVISCSKSKGRDEASIVLNSVEECCRGVKSIF